MKHDILQISPGEEIESDRYLIQIENVCTTSAYTPQSVACQSRTQHQQPHETSTTGANSTISGGRTAPCKPQVSRVGLKRKQMVQLKLFIVCHYMYLGYFIINFSKINTMIFS
jgi:hypothetical protein